MTILDRYIIRSYLSGYLILLGIGMGLLVFLDLAFNVDEFLENPTLSTSAVIWAMVDYYKYNIPIYFAYMCGPVMAAAMSFTFGLMLRNRELTGVLAAGVPLQRLAVPALAASVPLIALWVADTELLIPQIASKVVRQHDDLTGTRTEEVHCVRDDNNAILSARVFHASQGRLEGVVFVEPEHDGKPAQLIEADGATYDPVARTWRLDRGSNRLVAPLPRPGELEGAIRREPVDEYAFSLSPNEIQLRKSAQWAELMSLSQMNALERTQNLPNRPAILKNRDIRFTQPILMFILLMLPLPFFLTRSPGNVLVAGGKALLISGLCFGVTFIAHSISAESGAARMATALPVLTFGPLAVLLLANLKT